MCLASVVKLVWLPFMFGLFLKTHVISFDVAGGLVLGVVGSIVDIVSGFVVLLADVVLVVAV